MQNAKDVKPEVAAVIAAAVQMMVGNKVGNGRSPEHPLRRINVSENKLKTWRNLQ